jgi:putative DNA-invertase from lambdoid prophage Rac
VTVYGYARVSTERQADEGVSLEEQIRRIEGRALEQGCQLAETFIERGISASVPLGDRPEGARLLSTLQPGDVVIAAKLDRMFRSAWNALNVIREFQRRQISLWLLDLGGDVSGDGIAKLVLTILAAIAEFERERIGERIRDAKRHQKRTGQYLGGARPFGWERSGGPRQQSSQVTGGPMVRIHLPPAESHQRTELGEFARGKAAFRWCIAHFMFPCWTLALYIPFEHGLDISEDAQIPRRTIHLSPALPDRARLGAPG